MSEIAKSSKRYLARVAKEYEKIKDSLSMQVRELVEEQIKEVELRIVKEENIRPGTFKEDYITLRNKMIYCCRTEGYFTYEQLGKVHKISAEMARKVCEEFRD